MEREGKGKLMGDSSPQLLSSDEFYKKVVAFKEEQKKGGNEEVKEGQMRKES